MVSKAVQSLTRRLYGQCFRKKRFEEQWQARSAVKHGRAKGRDIGEPYLCPHGCGGWHIGHRGQA
jgi:hypothetical protein